MSLKQEMYKKQFGFIRSVLTYIVVLVLLYQVFPQWNDTIAEYIPNWLKITILVVWGLYVAAKAFFGAAFVLEAKQEAGRCFWGLLQTDEPRVPVNTATERYGLLVEGFYQSQEVLRSYKDELAELEKDPLFRPEQKVKHGDHFYLNAFECNHNEDAAASIKSSLSAAWDVESREQAQEVLAALWQGAQQSEETSVQAFARYALYDECIRDFGLNFNAEAKHTNASGFDLVRLVTIARFSFAAGYITEEELRGMTENAALFAAANYATWEHLAYSYLVSFIAWAEDLNTMGYTYIRDRIVSVKQYLHDSHSPLAGTSLDELRTELAKEAAAETPN